MKKYVKNALILILAISVLMVSVQAIPVYAASGTWKQNSKGWWYEYSDGSYASGWVKIGTKWYCFNSKGYMQTGWVKSGSKWYYLGTNGAMATGWQKVSGKWYYLGTNGAMTTGWQKVSGKWYYLGTNGALTTGWQKSGGKWYYLNPETGVLQTGWVKYNGSWYYLSPTTGTVVTGTLTINGKKYTFDNNGRYVSEADNTNSWKELYLAAISNERMNAGAGLLDVDNDGIPELFVRDLSSFTAATTMYYISNGKVESLFMVRFAGVVGNKVYYYNMNLSEYYWIQSLTNGTLNMVLTAERYSSPTITYYINKQEVSKETYDAELDKSWKSQINNTREINYINISTKNELKTVLNNY